MVQSILPGNSFEVYVNGDEIFPPMLAAIAGARRSISFETYIYWSGQVGKDFADALAERARAGVKVRVLLDWLGSSKMDKAIPCDDGAGRRGDPQVSRASLV